MMITSRLLQKILSLTILVLLVYITFVEGEQRRFFQGDPIKPFETIKEDIFCDKNAKGASQCSRMNKNYLKFFFSLFFTIAWGGAVRTVIKVFQLPIPYTVVLLITGLVVGLGTRINSTTMKFCQNWVMYTKFARTPPELILYIFLPLLIFESAFSMKAHVFMKNFLSIGIVALPGMILSTLFTAIGCRQFMESYGWTFSQAMLFGAIISATDPVAVVAILRELGTSENLSVMIEGESLLNDGVAILLYEIFKEIVEEPESQDHDSYKYALKFIQIAIGGPAFGFFMGKLSIWCLTMIFNDAATEITITLVSAYLTYFVGEFHLGVSGVMAVVLLGVTMNAGSTCISPDVMHAVHLFWETMSFLANTVLFVILGIVISETAINSFEIRDGINVIWLYLALNLIRLVMLFLMSPALRRVGYDASWKNLTVMMWGGLRGAVGICLALEVYRSKQLCHFPKVGPKFLLHTAGIVIMTLIINGSTTKSLLDYLGVTTLSSGKLQDMAHAVRNLTAARVRTIIALKHDRFLADANWEIVHRFTHLKDPYAKKQKADDTKPNNEGKLKDDKVAAQVLAIPSKINEKLIIGGHLSSAILQGSHIKVRDAHDNRPIVHVSDTPSMFLIHQGKVKRQTAFPSLMSHESVPKLEEPKNQDDEDISETPEFRRVMEECRCRVLKSMKISGWTQYEKGSLSEEAVKTLVSAIEQKEDSLLQMLHVSDLRDNWEIKGIVPWIRKQIMEFIAADKYPPKPEAKWRHPFYWLTTQNWFNGIIYFVIFVNLAPIIFETVLLIQDREPQHGLERHFLYGCTWTFTCLYLLEFILKVVGRGFQDYCSSKWNHLDFFVLLVSIAELIYTVLTFHEFTERSSNTTAANLVKNLRLIRFVRLFRWARPLMPMVNRIVDVRIRARLFIGYDVGTGYIQALEDALRFLPNMIQHKNIFNKFHYMLDEDRLQTVKEIMLLQMKHPGVVVAVKTRRASRAISGFQKEELETMKLEGLLEEAEFEALISMIDGNLKKLWAAPNSIKLASVDTMVDNIPWAVGHHSMLEFFKDKAEFKKHWAGDIIYEIGDAPTGIHLITSGIVKLHFIPTMENSTTLHDSGKCPNSEFYLDTTYTTTAFDYLGVGSVIGEYGYLTKLPRAASIVCETNVETVFWSNDSLDMGMSHYNDPFDSLEGRLWRSWGIKLATEYLHTTSQYLAWSGDKIRAHLEQSVVPIGERFKSLEIEDYIEEAILIYGELMNDASTEQLCAPAIVPTSWTKIGQPLRSSVIPKLLIIPRAGELETIQESDSQTSLQKVILHAPGVALNMLESNLSSTSNKSTTRRKSFRGSGGRTSITSGGRRKSIGGTVENFLNGLSIKNNLKGVRISEQNEKK